MRVDKVNSTRKTNRPVSTIAAIAAALLSVVVALFVVAAGGDLPGFFLLVPPGLGLVGALGALFSPRMTGGARALWAILSIIIGIALVPVTWMALILLVGP